METVGSIADRYGTSTTFVLKALGRLRYLAVDEWTSIPHPVVRRFDQTYGEKIKAARPTPVESGEQAAAAAPKSRERPRPLRVAYEKAEYGRDMQTMARYPKMPEKPGLAHALDVESTREGDPWRTSALYMRSEREKFYDHNGPRAACGKRVKVAVRDEFSDETKDPCPECLDLLNDGQAIGRFGQSGDYRESYFCDDFHRAVSPQGGFQVWECRLRAHHQGNHSDRDGNHWGDE